MLRCVFFGVPCSIYLYTIYHHRHPPSTHFPHQINHPPNKRRDGPDAASQTLEEYDEYIVVNGVQVTLYIYYIYIYMFIWLDGWRC